MSASNTKVITMRAPVDAGRHLKCLAHRRGWTARVASALLIEEGLRHSEFAFIYFRDSSAGRQAYIQGSTLAVWEVMLLVRSHKNDVRAVAKHLRWPQAKVEAAVNYAEAFPDEISRAIAENDSVNFDQLKKTLPQATIFKARRAVSTKSMKR